MRSVKREGSVPDGSEVFAALILALDGPAVEAGDEWEVRAKEGATEVEAALEVEWSSFRRFLRFSPSSVRPIFCSQGRSNV